ncbi:MAG: hypothetical protein HRT47_09395 [Candidatus Caenarcaniphilales bacterium]|nr:hypothetical protein [Candidatus Caenarcaniphilales bacterium]
MSSLITPYSPPTTLERVTKARIDNAIGKEIENYLLPGAREIASALSNREQELITQSPQANIPTLDTDKRIDMNFVQETLDKGINALKSSIEQITQHLMPSWEAIGNLNQLSEAKDDKNDSSTIATELKQALTSFDKWEFRNIVQDDLNNREDQVGMSNYTGKLEFRGYNFKLLLTVTDKGKPYQLSITSNDDNYFDSSDVHEIEPALQNLLKELNEDLSVLTFSSS